jgi:hypothetical protein
MPATRIAMFLPEDFAWTGSNLTVLAPVAANGSLVGSRLGDNGTL